MPPLSRGNPRAAATLTETQWEKKSFILLFLSHFILPPSLSPSEPSSPHPMFVSLCVHVYLTEYQPATHGNLQATNDIHTDTYTCNHWMGARGFCSPYGQHELLSFLAPSCRRRRHADLPPSFLPPLCSISPQRPKTELVMHPFRPLPPPPSLPPSLQLSFQSVKPRRSLLSCRPPPAVGHNRP